MQLEDRNLISFLLKQINTLRCFYFFFNSNEKKILQKNFFFKDVHANERCFILGNGPSLFNQDLSLLKNQTVFTVNNIMASAFYPTINPKYHFFSDPAYYPATDCNCAITNEASKAVLDIINSVKNGTTLFFPIEAYNFVKTHKVDSRYDVYFIKQKLHFIRKIKHRIDLTKATLSGSTVIHSAIIVAIYMGFRRIVLLGCDMTNFLSVLRSEDCNVHCYRHSTLEKNRLAKEIDSISNESLFHGYASMFSHYRLLYELCNMLNIELVNCTEGGVLDSLRREDYIEEVQSVKWNL